LLADYDHDFVLSINYLFGEGIASVCVGGILTKRNGRGKICWYSNPEDSKVYPIPLVSLHKNAVPKEHSQFEF
jgi:hypothetical protein